MQPNTSFFTYLIQNWLLVLLSTVIGILIAVILLFTLPNKYEAQALLRVGQVAEQDIESSSSTVQRLKSLSLKEEVVQIIHRKYPNQQIDVIRKELNKSIIELIKNTDIISITLVANSPSAAKERLSFYMSALTQRHSALSHPIKAFYEQQLIHAQEKLQSLNNADTNRKKLKTPSIEYNITLDSTNEIVYWNQQIFSFKQALTAPKTRPTSLVEPIASLNKPVSPKKVISILLGALLGLIFGIISLLIANQHKTSNVTNWKIQ